MSIPNIISVFIGAGIGGALRYMLGEWSTSRWGFTFPWHTFTINIVGSLLLGLLMGAGLQRGDSSLGVRLFLGVGLLGGFTTFSTLSYEAVALFQQGLVAQATANMFASVVLGVVAASVGVMIGRSI